MYLLEELVKEHQKELWREAELAYQLEQIRANRPGVWQRLLVGMGNFLIRWGSRLKGPGGDTTRRVHSPLG